MDASRSHTYPRLADTRWLQAQRDAGRTAVDIARELGCSDRAVGKALRAAGISPRPRGGTSRWGNPATRRLSHVAALNRADPASTNRKAPAMRPQPPRPDDALVVRVDRGWTSTRERAVLLVEPHHTLHQLAMAVVGLMADDRSDIHAGAYRLLADGRIVAPWADGHLAHLERSCVLLFSAAGFISPRDEWSGSEEDAPVDETVARTLGVGHACWLIWDLGSRETFSVRVLEGRPAGEVEGLGARGPQLIHAPDSDAETIMTRLDPPVFPDRWEWSRGH